MICKALKKIFVMNALELSGWQLLASAHFSSSVRKGKGSYVTSLKGEHGLTMFKSKTKGKGRPIISHEGTEGRVDVAVLMVNLCTNWKS
jgi:hypothetical protein